jgi:uncharacterized protein YbjT (DUF2867 family)
MTTLLLAGATGLVGSEALKLLLADPRVAQVVAPTRRALAPHAKLRNPIATIADLPLEAEWWAVDGAICALGTTRAKTKSAAEYRAIDYGYALTIATQVREGGARSFALCSSTGADARSWFRYTRTKGELEEAIGGLGFASFTIARPGFIGGERVENRPSERVITHVLKVAAPILPASARINPASTIAALLVEAALAATPGTRVIESAEIVRAGEGRR